MSNASGRYEPLQRIAIDDGWHALSPEESDRHTRWRPDKARSVITFNRSPDIQFDRSINPYRGCEHGCIYCFARPTHTWLGHSAGLDFERLLYAKTDAARCLRQALDKPGYRAQPIALGVNTDAWQPLERRLRITRSLLQVLLAYRHPVYVITKSALIERDIDVIGKLAERHLISVCITITTLDRVLARRLEPRATAPARRLRTLETLSRAGIPTRVSISPIIPVLNEAEIDTLVQVAAAAGATAASALMLRLPHEVRTLFIEWLDQHYPLSKQRVLKAIRSMRDNRLNDSRFTTRFSGSGPRADIIRRRFELACERAGLACDRQPEPLDCEAFKPPQAGAQLRLFD